MHTAYIGLGANLPSTAGPPEVTLAAAALRLASLGRVAARSSLYSTYPVGFAHQPRFVNAAIALETDLAPQTLLNGLLAIELEFGRDLSAGIANGPRTLDLDILLFDHVNISLPGLEIPHPRVAERAFVLIPLREIAPHAIDPGTGKTVTQLLHGLFPPSEGDSNAVVQIQADDWQTGPDGNGARADEPARTEPGKLHTHRRG
jgi:2-amino-4-hydroxy-6-hydroxymethyldihydropteridine diphosphokinase